MDETFPAEGALYKHEYDDSYQRDRDRMRLKIAGIGGLVCGWPPDTDPSRDDQEAKWTGLYDDPCNVDSGDLKRTGIECYMTEQYVIFRELEEDKLNPLLYRP